DCTAPLICARDGVCRAECRTDYDCVVRGHGSTCVQGSCTDHSGGCTHNSDCPAGQTCDPNGQCVAPPQDAGADGSTNECTTDTDCIQTGRGSVCVAGMCMSPAPVDA